MNKRSIIALFTGVFFIFNIISTVAYADSRITDIIAGYDNTFIITADGELFVAGKNANGQLGTGNTQNVSRFGSIVFDEVSGVSAGGEHVLITKTDGSLWAIGANGRGQLGDGTNESRIVPIKVFDSVTSFSAGYSHSAAVSDGVLFTWGDNGGGRLADGGNVSQNKPIKITDGVKFVCAGRYFNLVVKDDNSFSIMPNTSVTVSSGNTASGVLGMEHTLVLSDQNELYAFGYNAYGQLGNGTTEDSDKLVKVLDSVVQIAAGENHSLALLDDGTVWAWGLNSKGQLGTGNGNNADKPVKIMDGAASISASANHSAALKTDGTVWVWGSNEAGQLGKSGGDSNVPVQIDISENMASEWAVKEVMGARKAGLVPTELASRYRNNITRQEFAHLSVELYKNLGGTITGDPGTPFTDTNDATVAIAYNLGIVKGEGAGIFNPQSDITRQEICVMLHRTMAAAIPSLDSSVAAPATFADGGDIADWAEEAIQYAYSKEIMKGKGENRLAPLDNTTREEAILLSYRISTGSY